MNNDKIHIIQTWLNISRLSAVSLNSNSWRHQ